jgi:hypothetical protein
MQLAFFMGFTEVYLIGMDFDYVIPQEHLRNGNHILSTTDDPNHFHKDYFGKGKTWKDPKLDRVAASYVQAKLAFDAVGRRIYNATVGGKLEIFDRVDYEALLRDPATGKKRTEQVAPIVLTAMRQPLAGAPFVQNAVPQQCPAPSPKSAAPQPGSVPPAEKRTPQPSPVRPAAAPATPRPTAAPIGAPSQRPRFYAGFGEWLKTRSPGLFRMLQSVRRGLAGVPQATSRDDRGNLASDFRRKSPTLYRLLQLTGWSLRAASRHKAIFLLLLALCVALLALPLFYAPAWTWRYGLWVVVGLVVAAAAAAAILREAFRRIVTAYDAALSSAVRTARQVADKRFGEIEKRLAGQSAKLETRIKALHAEAAELPGVLKDLQAAQTTQSRRMTALAVKVEETNRQASARLLAAKEEAAAAQNKLAEGIAADVKLLLADAAQSRTQAASNLDAAKEEAAQAHDRLKAEIDSTKLEADAATGKLQADIQSIKSQAVSLDIVSALRPIRALWFGGNALEEFSRQAEIEHGHAVLMAALADAERENPGLLAGKTLIEIGTTRERDPHQGSTEKLAIFTALTGMHFVTVDMDPLNTKHAALTLGYLNPMARAVTAKGEDYLAREAGTLDFVYLDAFDFDHGKHSAGRQQRYQEMLGTTINDEACWKMHEDCARSIVAKMPVGGIVALDDTWTDAEGKFDGKGRLAMPLLLGNGFSVVAKTRMTVVLKRQAVSKPKAARRTSRKSQ